MAKKSQEQTETEDFIKEFFKTEISPDTWESEKTLGTFRVDGYNKELNIVWEYDGAMHYTKEDNIEKDKERDRYFISEGYKFIAIPYFCYLNKTVSRRYLKSAFGKAKSFEDAIAYNYEDAIKKAYGDWYPMPGWHGSPNIPFNFVEEGRKRFLKELDTLPEETQHQIVYSLKPVLEKLSDNNKNNLSKKDIIKKIRDFNVKDEHIKNWKSKLGKNFLN